MAPTRDDLLVDPRLVTLAENAARRIAVAERLDKVSEKEAYRTIIDVMVSGCLALETARAADAILE